VQRQNEGLCKMYSEFETGVRCIAIYNPAGLLNLLLFSLLRWLWFYETTTVTLSIIFAELKIALSLVVKMSRAVACVRSVAMMLLLKR
jgi:hypothetical protein